MTDSAADRKPSMTWKPVKRESATCYDVASENGIRCTPWPIAKLCHAKIRATLMQGTYDNPDVSTRSGADTLLRVTAHNAAFYRWEASDRSRNLPEAVRSWNRYVAETRVMSLDGHLSAIRADEVLPGATELPGILPTIAEEG